MSTVYPDLPAAMVGWLRAQPTVVAAFGDTQADIASTKIWGDEVRRGVDPPWAAYEEINKSTMYMTAQNGIVPYIDDMAIRWIVTGKGKEATRQLGNLIANGLIDAPLQWQGGRLMMIRPTGASFVPNEGIAPASPNTYVMVLTFAVQTNGTAPFPT